MIVRQLPKRDGLALNVENGVPGEGLPVSRLTYCARVDETSMRPSEVVVAGSLHSMKTALDRKQHCVMGVPAHQYRGIRRDGSKLRERLLGLLASADIRIGAREVAMAHDDPGSHFPCMWKRFQEGPRWGRQMLTRPHCRHDAGVHAS